MKLWSSELTLLPMLYKVQSDQRIVKRRRVRTAFYSSTILYAFFWYVHNVTTEGTEFDYASTIYVCHPKKYPIDSRFVVCSKGLDGWIVIFHAWVDLSSNRFYENFFSSEYFDSIAETVAYSGKMFVEVFWERIHFLLLLSKV